MFVSGSYGMGRSPIAVYCQRVAELRRALHPIYVTLGGVDRLNGVGERVLEATVRSGAFEPTRSAKTRSWLSKYVGEQELFGVKIRTDALKQDAPSITSGMLPFLGEVVAQLAPTGVGGVFLALDEIHGIADQLPFAHFLKGLVDTNATSPRPVTLFLMLCGTQARLHQLILHHQPVDRIFDIVDIEPLGDAGVSEFFQRSFGRGGIFQSAQQRLSAPLPLAGQSFHPGIARVS